MALKHKMIRNPDPEQIDLKIGEFLTAQALGPDEIKHLELTESETVGQITVLIVYDDGSGQP